MFDKIRLKDALTNMHNFPRGMIEKFAKTAPEEVRAMFIALFDESKDMYDRIKSFKNLEFTEIAKQLDDIVAEHFIIKGEY